MSGAHYKAPDRRITATQLAQAAGFSTYSGANLQYVLLGAMLFAEIPEELPRRPDGTRVTTFAIATGEYPQRSSDSPDLVWELGAHTAEASQTHRQLLNGLVMTPVQAILQINGGSDARRIDHCEFGQF